MRRDFTLVTLHWLDQEGTLCYTDTGQGYDELGIKSVADRVKNVVAIKGFGVICDPC